MGNDNRQVAHMWAAYNMGTTDKSSARSSNGNFSFSGTDILSYRTIIARFKVAPDGSRFVLQNTQRYSQTTSSKHQPAVRSALYGLDGVRIIGIKGEPTYAGCEWTEREPHKLALALMEEAGELQAKATRARVSRSWWLRQAEEKASDAAWLAGAYGFPLGSLSETLDKIRREREGAAAWANMAEFFRAYSGAAGQFFNRPLQALHDVAVGLSWLAGQGHRWDGYEYGREVPTLLRINGDTVETSRGAEFPLADGLRALPFICRAIREGRAYDFTPRLDGLSHGRPRLGHFAIDSVSAAGWVRAGCHTVPGWAVEWAAREAGVWEVPALDHVADAVRALRPAEALSAS